MRSFSVSLVPCESAFDFAAQRLALLALGRAWTLFGSRKNSKPEKYSKKPHAAKRQSPASSARFVGRSAASTHARYQITSKPRQTPVLLSYPKFCLNILCASSLVIVEYSGCPLGR